MAPASVLGRACKYPCLQRVTFHFFHFLFLSSVFERTKIGQKTYIFAFLSIFALLILENMKKIIYLLAALLLLLSSCKSKKNLVSPIPRPVLNVDSVRPDSSDVVARLFSPDTSELKKISVKRKREKTHVASPVIQRSAPSIVARGTRITSSAVSVSSVYPGIDRVKKYEFTHRDVPDAFDGFRIAFISDLHYKSLFKEKGLESLCVC